MAIVAVAVEVGVSVFVLVLVLVGDGETVLVLVGVSVIVSVVAIVKVGVWGIPERYGLVNLVDAISAGIFLSTGVQAVIQPKIRNHTTKNCIKSRNRSLFHVGRFDKSPVEIKFRPTFGVGE